MSAAAVAAGAMAVESANVVGYQEITVPTGFSMRGSTFKAISGSYKISDIAVLGEDIGGAGNDYAQKINADGSWGDVYYYLTDDGAGVEDGWYKDVFGDEAVTDADVIAVGESLFVTAASTLTFKFAGEVIAGKPEFVIETGFSMFGNPTPVTSTKISDIEVSGDIGGAGNDYIQKINADGSWGDIYYYLTDDGAGVEDGWYKDVFGDEAVTDADVLGEGESVFATAAGDLTLKFPAVL